MIIKNIEYEGYTIREKERSSEEAYSLCSGWRVVRYLVGMDYLW